MILGMARKWKGGKSYEAMKYEYKNGVWSCFEAGVLDRWTRQRCIKNSYISYKV
jgi:hypothetical protein